MQSQYVYLSHITQPLIALYFSVELSTLYKSAGFSFEYCLQFWTCIYSTNRVIVYFNLLWSVVYMLLNSTVSIWTKIRPSLVAATRIHLEALPPGMQELSGSWTTQQHGSHQCEAPVGQELKGTGQQPVLLPFFVGGWGFRMVIPTEKPRNYTTWICEMVGFPVIWVNWEERKRYRFWKETEKFKYNSDPYRIFAFNWCYIVSNVREFTLGTDWKKGTLGVKIDKCIALSGTQSS